MNKEEILNKYIDLIDKGYCCDCNELNCIDNFPQAKITHSIRELQQENKQLQAKVKQLETNIEEAIEYIKHSWWLRTDQIYDTSKDLKGWEVEELLSILERGKE